MHVHVHVGRILKVYAKKYMYNKKKILISEAKSVHEFLAKHVCTCNHNSWYMYTMYLNRLRNQVIQKHKWSQFILTILHSLPL